MSDKPPSSNQDYWRTAGAGGIVVALIGGVVSIVIARINHDAGTASPTTTHVTYPQPVFSTPVTTPAVVADSTTSASPLPPRLRAVFERLPGALQASSTCKVDALDTADEPAMDCTIPAGDPLISGLTRGHDTYLVSRTDTDHTDTVRRDCVDAGYLLHPATRAGL
jgi:hypothetical protein